MGKFMRRFVNKKRGMEALQSVIILAVAALLLSLLKDKGEGMINQTDGQTSKLIGGK